VGIGFSQKEIISLTVKRKRRKPERKKPYHSTSWFSMLSQGGSEEKEEKNTIDWTRKTGLVQNSLAHRRGIKKQKRFGGKKQNSISNKY